MIIPQDIKFNRSVKRKKAFLFPKKVLILKTLITRLEDGE
ncbi:hypothetical protein ELI_2975 [Eubacterium callanderi]|uniref:Uncharacterized protein n=1 Tax=Eubacterium callanderi TaxID=53442 RepID=E3GEF8_9FIRM|nr:hypothetical protein ELI_2975 [Eubacterium callanderi]